MLRPLGPIFRVSENVVSECSLNPMHHEGELSNSVFKCKMNLSFALNCHMMAYYFEVLTSEENIIDDTCNH